MIQIVFLKILLIDKNNHFKNNIINWLLRYDDINFNENQIENLILSKYNEFEKEIALLNVFQNDILINIYKKNSITTDLDNNINLLKQICKVIIVLYNNLDKTYCEIKKTLYLLFIKIRSIVLKYNPILKFG